MTVRRFAIFVSALVVALAPPARAGTIRGELWLAPPPGRTIFESGYASRGAPRREAPAILDAKWLLTQRGATDAVVFVERIPERLERKLSHRGWFRREPPMPRISQQNGRITPRVLTVVAGSAVEFRNLDTVFHNVFSVSAAKQFDLHKHPPGFRDTVFFENPGVVNLHCDIHPDEMGYLVVTANHAVARPDSIGRFALAKLPAGRYEVHAWHPDKGEIRREIQVPPHGDVEVVLRY